MAIKAPTKFKHHAFPTHPLQPSAPLPLLSVPPQTSSVASRLVIWLVTKIRWYASTTLKVVSRRWHSVLLDCDLFYCVTSNVQDKIAKSIADQILSAAELNCQRINCDALPKESLAPLTRSRRVSEGYGRDDIARTRFTRVARGDGR